MSLTSNTAIETAKVPQNESKKFTSNRLLERIKKRTTPTPVTNSGNHFISAFWDFFQTQVKNGHTRQAYQLAIFRFLDWCSYKGLNLHQIQNRDLAEYIAQHEGSQTTVRQHLSAIRKLLNWMVNEGLCESAPNISTSRIIDKKVSPTRPTPTATEARTLLDSVEVGNVVGLRDRAMIGVLIFCFSRVGQVVDLKVGDYRCEDDAWFLCFSNQKGEYNRVPVHRTEKEYLDTYLAKAGILEDKDSWMFRSSNRSRSRDSLTGEPMTRKSTLKMLKRRIREAGLPESFDCQSFRRTGIVEYLNKGGSLETAARLAGYESTRSIEVFLEKNAALENVEINRISI